MKLALICLLAAASAARRRCRPRVSRQLRRPAPAAQAPRGARRPEHGDTLDYRHRRNDADDGAGQHRRPRALHVHRRHRRRAAPSIAARARQRSRARPGRHRDRPHDDRGQRDRRPSSSGPAGSASGRSTTSRRRRWRAGNLGAAGMLGVDTLQTQRVSFDFAAPGDDGLAVAPRRASTGPDDTIVVTARSRFGRLCWSTPRSRASSVWVIIDTGARPASATARCATRSSGATGSARPQPDDMVSVTGGRVTADYDVARQHPDRRRDIHDLPIAFADVHPFRQLQLIDRPALAARHGRAATVRPRLGRFRQPPGEAADPGILLNGSSRWRAATRSRGRASRASGPRAQEISIPLPQRVLKRSEDRAACMSAIDPLRT